jgi:hypothetical protein
MAADPRLWQAQHPREAARWLSDLSLPWWIAGGWALDLFAGDQARPHADLDVGVLRRDVREVLAVLSSWDIFGAKHGLLTRLSAGTAPDADTHSLWCRAKHATCWSLEIMLDECDGADWVYRRQPEIRYPLTSIVRRSPGGLPYLAPEIQLLYKARKPRERDQADFDRIAPRLDSAARRWLHRALERSDPGHEWIRRLR